MKRSSTNRSRRPAARAMSTSKRGRDGRIASNAPSGCASMTRPSIRRPIFWPTLHFPTTGPRASGPPMRRWFALSAIGRDRPGIVADLAELIYECDCNLEDSRMTILGSEFAVLLLLSGQGADVERRLSTACKRLEWEKRLSVFFRPLDRDAPAPEEPTGGLLECSVTGVDK